MSMTPTNQLFLTLALQKHFEHTRTNATSCSKILFLETLESRKSNILEKTRGEKHLILFNKFLEILNMGPISFKKHAMDILAFFNSSDF